MKLPDFAGLNSSLIHHFSQIPLFVLSHRPYLSKVLQWLNFIYSRLKQDEINYEIREKNDTDRAEKINPLDTGYKVDVDKTLRIHAGRLPSVLYMFNLRPVPREGL